MSTPKKRQPKRAERIYAYLEAQRLRKRINELEHAIERERAVYSQEWFGGVNVVTIIVTVAEAAIIRTARRLGHACVLVGDDSNSVRVIALPHKKV